MENKLKAFASKSKDFTIALAKNTKHTTFLVAGAAIGFLGLVSMKVSQALITDSVALTPKPQLTDENNKVEGNPQA